MKNTKLITMIEGAIIAGVCIALSYIPLQTANAAFDLSLGLIPLGVYALRRGLLPGLLVGFVWGLLLIVLGKAFILTIPQVLLEYPLAFAFGGFGGIFSGALRRRLANSAATFSGNSFAGGSRGQISDNHFASEPSAQISDNPFAGGPSRQKRSGFSLVILIVVLSGIVAAVARWFFHYWAGVIFWGSYAPEGMSPYLYSFIANGASAAANAAMLAIVLSVLVRTVRTVFMAKDNLRQ